MEERLKHYIDGMFRDVPKTERAENIKCEILQNLIDRYRDLKAEGKDDEEAYAVAISSAGDLSGIVADLKGEKDYSYEYEKKYEGLTEKQRRRERKKCRRFAAVYWPVVVCFYFLISFLFRFWAYSWLIFIAAVTVENLYGFGVYKTDVRRRRNSLYSAIWTGLTVVYFAVSFLTMRWDVTWLIFIMGIALNNVVGALVFHNNDEGDD